MLFENLVSVIYGAGIVGAGGAGFPTHKKLVKNIGTIIINAAECEPLLKVDKFILAENFEFLCDALNSLIRILGASEAFFAVKKKNLTFDADYINRYSKIEIKEIKDIYPAGDEVVLTYEVTGKIIPEAQLPLSVGVMVLNVETLYNIAQALFNNKPVIHKYVCVAGDVTAPVTLKVPVGTPVISLLEAAGGYSREKHSVILGGPLMGRLCDPEKEFVTKTTKGLIVLPKQHSLVQKRLIKSNISLKRASAACCQCRACTDMCPRYLMGYSLEVNKTLRTVVNEDVSNIAPYMQAQLCCGCGVCDYIACTQDICPRNVCGEVKGNLIKNGIKYTNGRAPEKVRSEREMRLIPSSRILQRCGLEKYYRHVEKSSEALVPREITLPLRQHVGKPASPVVALNEKVDAGTIVAAVTENDIGSNIHSSIQGTVTRISNDSITITSGSL